MSVFFHHVSCALLKTILVKRELANVKELGEKRVLKIPTLVIQTAKVGLLILLNYNLH